MSATAFRFELDDLDKRLEIVATQFRSSSSNELDFFTQLQEIALGVEQLDHRMSQVLPASFDNPASKVTKSSTVSTVEIRSRELIDDSDMGIPPDSPDGSFAAVVPACEISDSSGFGKLLPPRSMGSSNYHPYISSGTTRPGFRNIPVDSGLQTPASVPPLPPLPYSAPVVASSALLPSNSSWRFSSTTSTYAAPSTTATYPALSASSSYQSNFQTAGSFQQQFSQLQQNFITQPSAPFNFVPFPNISDASPSGHFPSGLH